MAQLASSRQNARYLPGAVFPDDLIMVDDDGAVVIPAATVEAVAELAADQERLEEWIMREVDAGTPLPGLYPPNEAALARYESWKQRG